MDNKNRYSLPKYQWYTTYSPGPRRPEPISLLLPVAPLGKNLYEADASRRRYENLKKLEMKVWDIQDVDYVKFKADGFPERVPPDSTSLGHTGVMQNLLSTDEILASFPDLRERLNVLVKYETAEDRKTTIQ